MKARWQPTTNTEMLKARAGLYRQIRAFFDERGVLEVETPLLSSASGTDIALDPVPAQLDYPGNDSSALPHHYLQTSPEFPMKRLLASGSGAIYQLAKAFRNGESGKRHNPEFTMLEWYRPGYTMAQLMDEVDALVCQVLNSAKARRITYCEMFRQHLGFDPLEIALSDLRQQAQKRVDVVLDSDDADDWLDLLFSHCIEPALQSPVFITHYPPSQAALSRLGKDSGGREVAMRFELIAGGMELANGYLELTDANEQRRRFEQDNAAREQRGLPVLPVDERLLAAMTHGLGDCAGVALGVDRLLMLETGCSDIHEVIAFPVDRA